MSLNNFRVKLLSLAVSSAVLAFAPNLAFAKNYESEMVIIHPFQWSYDSIAKECTEYLGPAGFDGVQISQPAEHANKGNVWWAVYQPVNFNNFTTMTGNETQLKNMIKACNEAGVKVFADAVFNQRPNDGVGLGGSTYGNNSYPDGFNDGDFHHNGCSVGNYSDEWNVRQCALLGMTDTATDNSSTQDKIADFLVKLMDMGVYGFRIDAAKHMHYNDINAIMEKTAAKAGKRPPIYMEVIGNSQEAPDIQPNKYTFIDNSVVTDFSYVDRMKEIFDNGDYGSALTFGLAVDSDNAEVFVNNHDDEYHRCSAGTCSMGTQENPKYNLAQSWLAVWPKGKVRQIYSGYKFNSHDPAGPISADRCQGGWLCQHRVPFVLNAPRFARATRGEAVSTSGFSDNVLWFNRGSKGFYAMNTSGGEVTKSFNVTMADGTYCDILGATDPKNNPCGSDITVSGGKITVTIPSMSAIAICTDSQWCGKGVDPCETDPNGAACLCKGSQTTDGICVSYCQKYPETEGCYCLTNPTDSSCVSIPATKNNLCYAGTSNSWKFDPMTYSKSTGYWTIDVTLTGADKQRFKVAEGCAWTGNVYGASGTPGKLAINTSTDGDEYTTLTGDYTLKIKDADMTYEFVKAGSSNHDPVAGFTTQINGLNVTFTNTSKDEDGDTLTYSWNFGNGKTSTDKNPSVTYDEKGTYHVTLTVTDPSKASNTAEDDVTVGGGETTGYAKTAIRTSHDNYGTHELIKKSASSSEWTGEFNFTEATSFKIEALPNSKDQCIFLGGKAGEALKASGDFISVEAGEYTITFNESTKVLTVTKKETVVDDKKANCDKDGSTNNCETSSLAYTFLGASYTPTATTFRLWSPDSSNVSVTVNGQTYTMSKTNVSGYSDVYEAVVEGDLDGKEYQFKVNGSDVHDPYGKMVKPTNYTGTGAVAENNVNIVMNMRDTDLPNGWAERPALKEREDSIVYEVHVRDFTIDSSSGVSAANRGRYLGMVEAGTTNSKGLKTGLDHLKDLGITHVQLLPVYDYGTCSNVDSQDSSCYNWGYDPVNFNVPEDRYTSVFGTENYKQKVKEFKTMVDEFHKNGIRVIMDVVYNHTYSKDVFSKISGKYYTSVDLSGCGNSVDAKNDMVSRFIRDSLEYWATEYNIDGFRFDLVGIFDVSDFKEWGEYLNNKYPDRKFLMYGEPWNGYATDPSESTRVRLGTIRNAASGHVGVFNGKYRECLKGGSDNAVGGFLFNKTYSDVGDVDGNFGCVMAGIKGGVGDSTNTWTPLFAADPEQAVQYITAHDNLNWTDKITKMGATGDYAKRLQAYGNGVILVSQGIPFIHAGEEFGRTKNMNENSYKSADGSNDIKWDVKTSYKDTFDYYKNLIAMRKAHPAFRMTTKTMIENNIKGSQNNGAIVVDINGQAVGDSWSSIKMVINSGNNLTIDGVDGWKKKVHAVTVNDDGTTGTNVAEGTAVTIWYK
ncbi:MAG: PKD domain-containing protein [Ruminobacter sp.]|uniref:alpha-amylase family glycosyl hydrolase n=1 Tax=Ruminobacter sp. TaxID=2774296 RepID=UPI0025802259|nr:alpha-amylase family glycosyl hydrolase [Ruminobacter sp.]MBQ3776458.1 PKD domain-containing protein [Ruminobacter sp.]